MKQGATDYVSRCTAPGTAASAMLQSYKMAKAPASVWVLLLLNCVYSLPVKSSEAWRLSRHLIRPLIMR